MPSMPAESKPSSSGQSLSCACCTCCLTLTQPSLQAANPLCKYNFMHFNCMRCQRAQARQRQQLLGRAAAAAAAAAEQQGLAPGGVRSWDQPPSAAAAAAGNGVPRQRQGRGRGSSRRYRRRSAPLGERSSSGDEDHPQASSSGYGVEDSDGAPETSTEDYLVEIDPVLLLILQGALYINRRRRNAGMRHPSRQPRSWGRAMLSNLQHPAGGWLPPLKTDPLSPSWRSQDADGSWRRQQQQQQRLRDPREGFPGAYADEEDMDWAHAARHRGVPGTWGMRDPQERRGSWQQQQQRQQQAPPRVTAVKSSGRPHPGSSLAGALLGIQASTGGSGSLMPPMAAQGDTGGLHLLAAVAPGSPAGAENPAAAAGGLAASARRHLGLDAGLGPSHAARWVCVQHQRMLLCLITWHSAVSVRDERCCLLNCLEAFLLCQWAFAKTMRTLAMLANLHLQPMVTCLC
jgi:hypothetical protein